MSIRKIVIDMGGGKPPKFQMYYRLLQSKPSIFMELIYKLLFRYHKKKNLIELHQNTEIGEGLYIGHAMCITINPETIIGKNLNIHKGVTIGQENRGPRKGVPTIGDNVWIGINSTIVGKIRIGNDVLVAPNTYINCDVPDHSVVFGNPCVIKHRDNATEGYINRTV